MAKLISNFSFIGSLGGVTAYKMKGCDHIVLRATAGPSQHRIETDPSYERTRENNVEFRGAGRAGQRVRWAINGVIKLADYNFQSDITKISKAIQKLDPTRVRGEKGVHYSLYKHLLKGFDLNKYHAFDSIVKNTLEYTIDRATGSATINIPQLLRGINLLLPWPTPQFRFSASIGVCDDMQHDPNEFEFYSNRIINDPQTESVTTKWYPAHKPFKGDTMKLSIKDPSLLNNFSSLIVAVGIEFDMTHRNFGADSYLPSGSAKILDLG